MVKKQDVTGPDTDDHGQDKLRMVKALSALPYHPVFHVSGDASSSSCPPYSRVVPQMLQFPEQHQVIYPVHPSLQSRMEGNTVFITPHAKEPCYQESVSLVDSSNIFMAQQLHRLDGRSMILQEIIRCDRQGSSFVRGSSEDASKVMSFLDMCFHTLFDNTPATEVCSTRIGQTHDLSGSTRPDVYFTRAHTQESEISPSIGMINNWNRPVQNFSVSNIKGHVTRLCTDRFGSRFIQDNIATATPDEKAMVFVEIIPHVAELVIDAFANYVVQKLMEHGSPSYRRIITEFLIGNVLRLSCDKHACRVIQTAIEICDLDQKIRVAEELDGNIIRCIDDQNANHVVQKCIECMPQEHVLFIYQNIYGHVVELSAHQYGCRVIQRVLEYCNDPSIQKNILSEIMEQIYWLAKDQYGNYVVQHLLQHGARPLRSAIIKTFAGRVVGMSRGKCSSNVIEKCLIHGDYEEKQLIINEVLSSGGVPDALTVMVGDPFANYVVQKVMETCDDWQRQMILGRLKTYLGELSVQRLRKAYCSTLDEAHPNWGAYTATSYTPAAS
ncbi:hypothetical protein EJB05_00917, partial [Eragrostis curvula]